MGYTPLEKLDVWKWPLSSYLTRGKMIQNSRLQVFLRWKFVEGFLKHILISQFAVWQYETILILKLVCNKFFFSGSL